MRDDETRVGDTGSIDLSAYLTLEEMLAALSRAGIAMPYRNLLQEANDEAALIESGEKPKSGRIFVRIGKPWFVHCLRYCESWGIDASVVCPGDDDTSDG